MSLDARLGPTNGHRRFGICRRKMKKRIQPQGQARAAAGLRAAAAFRYSLRRPRQSLIRKSMPSGYDPTGVKRFSFS
jgi:hypothetical protein